MVIRVEAREVPVDVTVTGRRGASTGDLTAKDFAIWEDGKQQRINSVSSASADPETSQKHFVLYLDFNTMPVDNQRASEKFAAEFIDGLASPDRYMAVASLSTSGPRVLQDFTTARAALKKAVEVPLDTNVSVNAQGNPVLPLQLAGSLTTVCNSIAPAPGRKALMLFTGGYSVTTSAFKAAITACNRANVAMYVIAASGPASATGDIRNSRNVPGLPTPGVVNLNIDPDAAFAQFLAEGTGGRALGLTASLPDELAGIAREQDEYYRVSYTPPPAKEGSCHTLRVAINTRGLVTRARNEYCTEKPVDLVAGRIAGQELASRAAGAGGTLGATMQLPYFYTGTNRASIHLSLEVVPAGMKFQKDKTGLHGQIDLVGTTSRPDGGAVARFADTVNIDLESQQGADAFTRAPYHYDHQFTVAAGKYVFQMAIGASPNAVGKLEAPLEVEPWNSASFGIGGIALSTEARPVDPASASGAPILEGRAPLVAGGKQFIPAATNRFERSQQVYFYTEVYDPALGSANPPAIGAPALTMQFRVLDRTTGEIKQDTGTASAANYVRPGNPLVPFATRLSVAQLPAGSYRLEVRAGHSSSQETVARTIDFDLNQ